MSFQIEFMRYSSSEVGQLLDDKPMFIPRCYQVNAIYSLEYNIIDLLDKIFLFSTQNTILDGSS
jgi:hypothetical protein